VKVDCVVECNNLIGEAPVWAAAEGVLYWVDIPRCSLHRMNPSDCEISTWTVPSEIGSFALREQGGAVVALRDGFWALDLEDGSVEKLVDPEPKQATNRFNDGKCDRRGRFWAGTMDDRGGPWEPTGALYRLDPDLSWHKMRPEVAISNGLGWSPDDKTMYYADSGARVIYAYDFDLDEGTISNERVFARPEGEVMAADGMSVDSDGCIWSVQWDGWAIIRYTPAGEVDRRIEMPVQRATSCTFGGSKLDQLYVTSASVDLTPAEHARGPLAGALFIIDSGVTGLPDPRFAG
jgi:sugar lactone lactonase YvrE